MPTRIPQYPVVNTIDDLLAKASELIENHEQWKRTIEPGFLMMVVQLEILRANITSPEPCWRSPSHRELIDLAEERRKRHRSTGPGIA